MAGITPKLSPALQAIADRGLGLPPDKVIQGGLQPGVGDPFNPGTTNPGGTTSVQPGGSTSAGGQPAAGSGTGTGVRPTNDTAGGGPGSGDGRMQSGDTGAGGTQGNGGVVVGTPPAPPASPPQSTGILEEYVSLELRNRGVVQPISLVKPGGAYVELEVKLRKEQTLNPAEDPPVVEKEVLAPKTVRPGYRGAPLPEVGTYEKETRGSRQVNVNFADGVTLESLSEFRTGSCSCSSKQKEQNGQAKPCGSKPNDAVKRAHGYARVSEAAALQENWKPSAAQLSAVISQGRASLWLVDVWKNLVSPASWSVYPHDSSKLLTLSGGDPLLGWDNWDAVAGPPFGTNDGYSVLFQRFTLDFWLQVRTETHQLQCSVNLGHPPTNEFTVYGTPSIAVVPGTNEACVLVVRAVEQAVFRLFSSAPPTYETVWEVWGKYHSRNSTECSWPGDWVLLLRTKDRISSLRACGLTTELQAEFSAKFLILASFKSLPFYALLNRQDFETPGRLGLVQGPLENFCFGANNSTGAIGSASALGGKILGGTNSLSNSHLVSYLFRDTAGGGNGSGAFFSFRDWFGTFQFGLSEEWPRNSSYSPSIACLIPTERESETQAITAIRTLEGSLEYRRALIDDRTQAALIE